MSPAQVLRHEPFADERLWEAAVAGPYEGGVPVPHMSHGQGPPRLCSARSPGMHRAGQKVVHGLRPYRVRSCMQRQRILMLAPDAQGCQPAGRRWRVR